VTEGFRVPEGEVYQVIESPRGELGFYVVSDGGAKPYRVHMRTPSFGNLQAVPKMVEGTLIRERDRFPRSSMAVWILYWVTQTADDLFSTTRSPICEASDELSRGAAARGHGADAALRAGRGGAHLRGVDRGGSQAGGRDRAPGKRGAFVLSMLHRQPLGKYHVQICTNISCLLHDGDKLWEHTCKKLGIGHKQVTGDGQISIEEVECIGACSWAPAIQVNYDFHHFVTPEKLDRLFRRPEEEAVRDAVQPTQPARDQGAYAPLRFAEFGFAGDVSGHGGLTRGF